MAKINVDPNSIGIRQVLAGLTFPAQRWQVIAQAQYYGATADCLTELLRLPVRSYHNLTEIAAELLRQRQEGKRVLASSVASLRKRQPRQHNRATYLS